MKLLLHASWNRACNAVCMTGMCTYINRHSIRWPERMVQKLLLECYWIEQGHCCTSGNSIAEYCHTQVYYYPITCNMIYNWTCYLKCWHIFSNSTLNRFLLHNRNRSKLKCIPRFLIMLMQYKYCLPIKLKPASNYTGLRLYYYYYYCCCLCCCQLSNKHVFHKH
jgi:hypothetical protein